MILSLLLFSSLVHADPADDIAAQIQSWRAHRGIDTAPTIPASTYRAAMAGEIQKGIEVVENIKAAKGYGVAVFDLPIALMWQAITDEDHHAGRTPVHVSKTIAGTPRKSGRTIYQFMEIPLVTDRWWMVRIRYSTGLYTHTDGRAWELTWHDRNSDEEFHRTLNPSLMAEGMPVAWTKGAWLLVALDDGRTLLEYHTWSDPGGHVPVGPATRFAAGEVANALKVMEKIAKDHIPSCGGQFYRPDGQKL
jgi:hypothetical protein